MQTATRNVPQNVQLKVAFYTRKIWIYVKLYTDPMSRLDVSRIDVVVVTLSFNAKMDLANFEYNLKD